MSSVTVMSSYCILRPEVPQQEFSTMEQVHSNIFIVLYFLYYLQQDLIKNDSTNNKQMYMITSVT